MAKLGTAYVNIRANLKPLRAGLGLAKAAVGKAMKAIGAVVKKAYAVAKKAALAFAAAVTVATFAAMKQEEAEFTLASQMKLRGEEVDRQMKKAKDFANAMQRVTKYGDEETLMLMRQAYALGISSEKIQDAVKAAMSLTGMIGGRMKPRMALKMISEALGGSTATLAPYVKGLRDAKNETEAWMLLNEAFTRGWDVVTSEAKTGFGALKQMKGIIGDIAEKFGAYFIPSIQNWRQAMWELKPTLEAWAATAGATTKAVKDYLVEVVKYVVSDFPAAWKAAKEMIVKIFTALADSIRVVWQALWEDLGANIGIWIKRGMAKRAQWKEFYKLSQERSTFKERFTKSGNVKEDTLRGEAKSRKYADFMMEQMKPEMEDVLEKRGLTYKRSNVGADLKSIFTQLGKDLKALEPKPLADKLEEIKKTLKEAQTKIDEDLAKALAAGPPKVKPPSLTGAGATSEEEKKKKAAGDKSGIGFVGVKEAWQSFVGGLKKPELKELKGINDNTKELVEVVKKQNINEAQPVFG